MESQPHPGSSLPVRVFTVEEANALLPEVEAAIRWFRGSVGPIVELGDAISVLDVLDAKRESSPEHRDWLDKTRQRDERVRAYQREQLRFQKLGCLIKDIDVGMVDFYSQREGQLVFLCWRLGETEIAHWHEIDAGFRGRRPIGEF